ncbi:MAG: ABC transporter ATP-binding protein [Thermoplasmata archaeon]|nr:MAG: ABC transporter ATP-binding protein [Thermoplasmata archaeon]
MFMVAKKVKCPKCGNIIKIEGNPGEKITIVCPKCSTKGVYIFPKKDDTTRDIKEEIEKNIEYVIQVRGLSKTYNSVKAVQDVSFNVKKGEIFGFLGPNGAGKTTTIKSILGLIHIDGGYISINGYDITKYSKKAKKYIGYLPEKVAFYDNLTAYQNLCFYADIKNVSRDACKPLLQEFGLIEAMNKKVGTFSKGMKQRLGMARAILGNPAILILDEPSNGLDPRGVALVRRKILQMKEDGTTVFISSHILSEIQEICDRVAIINKGVIVAEDSVENLGAKLKLKPRMIIELEEISEDIVETIRRMPGVEHIDVLDKRKLEVICNSEIKAKVILAIEENKGKILNLQTKEPTLEEVFLRLTEGG